MNEVSGSPGLISRTRSGEAPQAPSRAKAQPATAGAVFAWIALIGAGTSALAPVVSAAADELSEFLLINTDTLQVSERVHGEWPDAASPGYYEAMAELALMVDPPQYELALLAARRAVDRDPSRAYAQAMVAYLESDMAGAATPDAFAAIEKSMDACGVCSRELVRWRFNFVLNHWDMAPEGLRARAFEHADILRWSGSNAEFLAEMRFKAVQAGIPFDAYRAAVNTPVRSWDIGPAPGETTY